MALRGVNLGGWFVIEKWMTPSLFEGSSAHNEFELSKTKNGRNLIAKHHETYIMERDLMWLKERQIDIVRVPIGHWTLGGDARYVEATQKLDWLMETCDTLGLQVLLDLHAAPGAQNRAEHSGSGDTMSDKRSTAWLHDRSHQEETIQILENIAKRYHNASALWGIELLNEPATDITGLRLAWFYRRAYTRIIKVARKGVRIIFSDGYAPIRLTNCYWLMVSREHPVAMDCHIYQTFGKRDKKRSFKKHISRLRRIKTMLRFLQLQQPVIVGEWSGVLPVATAPAQTKEYLVAQHRAFSHAVAHFYWNYKTEAGGRWSYRDMVEDKLVQ